MMAKELWILVKMLFLSRPSDIFGKDLELVIMQKFPFKGFRFMCWCGKIILRQERVEIISRFLHTEAGKISMKHEKGHALQAISEHGDNWLRFYLSYFWHWLKHCPWIAPSSACYFFNRYEVECFAKEADNDYWEDYTRHDLRSKYTIKHPREKWRELGSNAQAWKAYVRTL